MKEIIILGVLIGVLKITVFSKANIRGREGEKEVQRVLKRLRGVKIINNLIIKNYNSYCQIDHVVVTKAGVYVIETKNYSGVIYGTEKDIYWTAVYGKKKYKIYSPVEQNKKHIEVLRKHLKINNIKSIIIFADDSVKLNTRIDNVYKINEFADSLDSIIRTNGTNDIAKIYKYLKAINVSNSLIERFKQVQFAKKQNRKKNR